MVLVSAPDRTFYILYCHRLYNLTARPSQGMKVAVLGGGVSGLSVAWGLLRAGAAGCSVAVFERTGRCGGWIHSKRTEQGAVLETGPRSMRPAERPGKTGLWLVSSV